MSTHRRGTSQVTLGSVQELVLFNIFVSDADNGMECKLSKFVDNIEPSSAKITTEGRDAIQKDHDLSKSSAQMGHF